MSVYEGNENYIFISYAHKDSKMVMKVVEELMARGYRVWYDEGIAPGSEWPENIAQHMERSAAVVAFVTPNAMASDNCRREIHFALSHKKPFLSVFLERTELPLGMELQLAAQQSVLQYNFRSEQEFMEKICSCEHLQPCLISAEHPAASALHPKSASSRKKKWLAYACAGLAAAAALGFAFSGKQPITGTANTEAETLAVETTEEPEETEASAVILEPVPLAFMRKAETSNGVDKESGFWGQEDYRREQVRTVQFEIAQEAPASAWDISEDGDGTIFAWMDEDALHVAANGKITTSDASYLFVSFDNLETIDWGDCFDTAAATDMSYMFRNCQSLTSVDVSGFNTSTVTDMRWMFYRCSALTELDVSSFDTSAVTSMAGMFGKCSSLTSLDLSNFDTSAVTDMHTMFNECSALTSVDVSGFNTGDVTDMRGLFWNCTSLVSLNITHFDTSSVKDMSYMFNGCSALTKLDVSRFVTSAATNTDYMFLHCTKLPKASIPKWYKGFV